MSVPHEKDCLPGSGLGMVHSLAGFVVPMVRAWNQFWFTPADPTPLGMIRICCGLVVLYIHLAYSYDLQAFFGRDAWLSLDRMNEFRKELPWVGPSTGWDQPAPIPASNAEEEKFINRWGVHPSQVMTYGQPLWS